MQQILYDKKTEYYDLAGRAVTAAAATFSFAIARHKVRPLLPPLSLLGFC